MAITKLSHDLVGFSKNPFDAPINTHVDRLELNGNTVTDESWLRSGDWLEKLECSTADWAESLVDEQRAEFDIFLSWLEKSPERFYNGLHLGDKRFWLDSRGDSRDYVYHLNRYAELHKMVGAFAGRACDILFRKVSQLYADIGILMDTILSG